MPDIGDTWSDMTLSAFSKVQADETKELRAEQQESKEGFVQDLEERGNPFMAELKLRRQKLETPKSRIQKMMEPGEVKVILPIEALKQASEKFQRKNPELKENILMLLREKILPGDTREEILKKLREFFPDVTLADEVLDFLLETTDGELKAEVKAAQDSFRKDNDREIQAGRNIAEQARSASSQGLGSPTSLRDMYRDITGNPRDPNILFDELSKRYGYKDLRKVIDFLLHSLGADMKSKGPSIPRGLLHRLLTETRSLQAILGVYRFFNNRMGLITSQMTQGGLPVPKELNFEQLAKLFMELAGDRYPSPDKISQTAHRLGIDKWILAKIIAFSQFRDAVKEVAVNQVYRSIQHRDELLLAILELLEELEDALEEQLGQEGEEEQQEDQQQER